MFTISLHPISCLSSLSAISGIQSTATTGLGSSSSGLRWDLESTVLTWIEEGSTLIGSWPEPLRDSWDCEIKLLKNQFEEEIEKLKIELGEVNFNFNSYKSRAQTGDKRLKSFFIL